MDRNNSGNNNIRKVYSAFREEESPMQHYNVRILKLMPTKVMINGRIKDRTSLSANERNAVKAQEEIDRAREILYSQNKQKIQNNLL